MRRKREKVIRNEKKERESNKEREEKEKSRNNVKEGTKCKRMWIE